MTHSCDECTFAKWTRTSNGRLHPDKTGQCTYQVKVPKLPEAFYWSITPTVTGGFIRRGEKFVNRCAFYNREPAKRQP